MNLEKINEKFPEEAIEVYQDENGKEFKTVIPQFVIDRLIEVFGLGMFRLVVDERTKETIAGPNQVTVVAHLEYCVMGKWHKTASRSKGVILKDGESVGNAMNQCESMLYLPCARELGIGAYLYREKHSDVEVASPAPKHRRPVDKGDIATKEAESKVAETKAADTTPTEEVEPIDKVAYMPEEEKLSGGPLNLLEEIDGCSKIEDVFRVVKKRTGVTRAQVEKELGIGPGNRVSKKKVIGWASNLTLGLPAEPVVPESLDFDSTSDENEEVVDDLFAGGEEEPQEEETTDDGPNRYMISQERRTKDAVEVLRELRKDFGLMTDTYNGIIAELGLELPPELISYNTFAKWADEEFIALVKSKCK